MLKSWRRFCTWMATELEPGPINPTMGFFPCISRLPASAVHLPWLSSSSLDTSVSRMNSMLCSRATAECQHESLVNVNVGFRHEEDKRSSQLDALQSVALKDPLVQQWFEEAFFAIEGEATADMRFWQLELVISSLHHPKYYRVFFKPCSFAVFCWSVLPCRALLESHFLLVMCGLDGAKKHTPTAASGKLPFLWILPWWSKTAPSKNLIVSFCPLLRNLTPNCSQWGSPCMAAATRWCVWLWMWGHCKAHWGT